jgi:hypothetical protein
MLEISLGFRISSQMILLEVDEDDAQTLRGKYFAIVATGFCIT